MSEDTKDRDAGRHIAELQQAVADREAEVKDRMEDFGQARVSPCYTCRMCGEVFALESIAREPAEARADLEAICHLTLKSPVFLPRKEAAARPLLHSFVDHDCGDSRFGIAELIGYAPVRP